jgi:hypothetical protein
MDSVGYGRLTTQWPINHRLLAAQEWHKAKANCPTTELGKGAAKNLHFSHVHDSNICTTSKSTKHATLVVKSLNDFRLANFLAMTLF